MFNKNYAQEFTNDSSMGGLAAKGNYLAVHAEAHLTKSVSEIAGIIRNKPTSIVVFRNDGVDAIPVEIFSSEDFLKIKEIVTYHLNSFSRKLSEYASYGIGDYTGEMISSINAVKIFMKKTSTGNHRRDTIAYVTSKKNEQKINVCHTLLRRPSYEHDKKFKSNVHDLLLNAMAHVILVREESAALQKIVLSRKEDKVSIISEGVAVVGESINNAAAYVEELYHRIAIKSKSPLKRISEYTPIIKMEQRRAIQQSSRISSMEESEVLTN